MRDAQQKIIREDMDRIYRVFTDYQLLEGKSVLITGATGMLSFYIVRFFAFLKPTLVLLSIGGVCLDLSIIAAIEAAAIITKHAITIPAIAPPDKPPELFLYLTLL